MLPVKWRALVRHVRRPRTPQLFSQGFDLLDVGCSHASICFRTCEQLIAACAGELQTVNSEADFTRSEADRFDGRVLKQRRDAFVKRPGNTAMDRLQMRRQIAIIAQIERAV